MQQTTLDPQVAEMALAAATLGVSLEEAERLIAAAATPAPPPVDIVFKPTPREGRPARQPTRGPEYAAKRKAQARARRKAAEQSRRGRG